MRSQVVELQRQAEGWRLLVRCLTNRRGAAGGVRLTVSAQIITHQLCETNEDITAHPMQESSPRAVTPRAILNVHGNRHAAAVRV